MRQVCLHGQFDLVAFDGDDAAFVIAVARGARTAEHLVAVGLESGGEFIDGLRAAQTESDVRVPGACEGLGVVLHARASHDFEACGSAEAEEIRAEIGGRVMVLVVRCSAQVGDEEILRRLEVVHIQCHVVDVCDVGAHGASFLVGPSVSGAVQLVSTYGTARAR